MRQVWDNSGIDMEPGDIIVIPEYIVKCQKTSRKWEDADENPIFLLLQDDCNGYSMVQQPQSALERETWMC